MACFVLLSRHGVAQLMHSPWQMSIEGTLLGAASLVKGSHSYGVPSTAVREAEVYRQWL